MSIMSRCSFCFGIIVLVLVPTAIDLVTSHACAQQDVPVNKVWLAEIGLYAGDLIIANHVQYLSENAEH